MNNLYFEINPKKNYITSQPKQLEHNWRNISGIVYYSQEELKDLSWAGYDDFGFIKICKENAELISNFKSTFNVLESLKTLCRKEVSTKRYECEVGIIQLNEKYLLQLTEECKLSIVMKYLECLAEDDLTFDWKFINGHFTFTANKFKVFYKKIQEYTQKLFDMENSILHSIENTNTVIDLFNIELNINCDGKITL